MAQCFVCYKALHGSWNMTACDGYEGTGRYLGITDGYFLYGESPNWVHCYCKRCWQEQILTLSFVPNGQEIHTLYEQSASYEKQIEEHQKFVDTFGIEKLQHLFKQLNSSQIDALHTHTNFRVGTSETVHGHEQIQCATQFVQSTLTKLRSSVDAIIQLQKNTSQKAKEAKESVFQTLTNAGLPKTTIDASIQLLETEIERIETDIQEWHRFLAVLTNTINQSVVS